MDTKYINGIPCYSGDIVPEPDVVFVFGSNPEGRHGAGAARVARERFGAVYGQGEGLQGNAYALPTKDLRVRENDGLRSVSPEAITESIRTLYAVAKENPGRKFCVAYRNTDRASLNGYTGLEMIDMFNAAGTAPSNVVFSEEWGRTGRLARRRPVAASQNNQQNSHIMPTINFFQTESSGYPERTRENADRSDITVAIAADYNTLGEKLTRTAASGSYIAIPIDAEGVHHENRETTRAEARLAADEFIQKVKAAVLPMPMKDITLNVAGNGLYTLIKNGITQEDVDVFMTEFVSAIQESGDMSISEIRSGGQTGIDEAGVKAALANGIDVTVLAPNGWRYRGADNKDVSDEASFKARFDAAIREAEAKERENAPAWARRDPDGFEVSTRGDEVGKRFSALNATFDAGTVLMVGGREVDAGGRTIEDVYQNEVKRSGKNLPPSPDSVLFVPEGERTGMDAPAMEDRSYERGYFPLWAVWAGQHPADIEALREAAAGRTLTDAYARTRVSQARALSEIIRGRTLNPLGAVVDRETYLRGQEAPAPAPAPAPAEAPAPGMAEVFREDGDALDLAYTLTYGGALFNGARQDALIHRLAAMNDEQRVGFREAVLGEVDRLHPELRGVAAPIRAANALPSPDEILDGLLNRAVATDEKMERIEMEIADLETRLDELTARREGAAPAEVAALNARIVPLAAERRQAEASFEALRRSVEDPVSLGGVAELELSARHGTEEFSLHNMRFLPGTKLGSINIGGMSVEDVYWKYVAKTEPGMEPRADSIVAQPQGAPLSERNEIVYVNGVMPLVSIWAGQHPAEITALKARMRRNSPAGAGPALRLSNSAEGRLSSARALTDIVNNRVAVYTREELDTHFAHVPRPVVNPALTRDALEGYQVYTVGTAKRSDENFWSLIPEDTDIIVDVRQNQKPQYRRTPGTNIGNFHGAVIRNEAEKLGMSYISAQPLSGELPVTRNNFRQMLDDPRVVADKSVLPKRDAPQMVYDYAAYVEDAQFQRVMKGVLDKVAEGKKVCLVGAKGDPSYSAVGLMLGQYIESNTDYHVGHIATTKDNVAYVMSQEDVVSRALGRAKTLKNKNFDLVRFQSDRSYSLPVGEELVATRTAGVDDVRERLKAGEAMPWNYGSEVEFRQVAARDFGSRPARSSGHWASIQANAKQSDFSIILSTGRGDRQVQEMKNASYSSITVPLPRQAIEIGEKRFLERSRREDFYDEELIMRAADRVSKRLLGQIGYCCSHRDEPYLRDFNPDNVRIFIGGSTLPNIANETQFNEEGVKLDETKPIVSMAGYTLDDSTGISQEDVNHFVKAVLQRVMKQKNEASLDNGDKQLFTIGEITSNYDTGAGEAAITAAQELGLKPTVIYSSPVVTIDDNDTSLGHEVRDEAMFRNRARGLREDVTVEMLQEQIDEKEKMDVERKAEGRPGLSDTEMVALWELGFDNTEMMDIFDVAERHNVVINDSGDLYNLIETSKRYGLVVPGTVDEDSVKESLRSAEERMKRWKADGITVVSAASPLYPDNLRLMPDWKEKTVITQVDASGFESEKEVPVTKRRPAILWAKGDLTLLNQESVGLLHNKDRITSAADKRDIRRFTTIVAENEMPLVTSLDNGASTALDMLDAGGRVIALSSDGIPVADSARRRVEELTGQIDSLERMMKVFRGTSAENLASAMTDLKEKGFVTIDSFGDLATPFIPEHIDTIMENKDMLLGIMDEYPDMGVYDALVRKTDDLSASRAVNNRIIADNEDVSENIVRKGGLLLSENVPGQKAEESEDRPNKILAGMSSACAVLSEMSSSKQMGLLEMAARSIYLVALLADKAVTAIGAKKVVREIVDAFKLSKEVKETSKIDPATVDPADFVAIENTDDGMQKVADMAMANSVETERNILAREEAAVTESKQASRSVIPKLEPFKESRLFNRLSNFADTFKDSLWQSFGAEDVKLAQAEVDVYRLGRQTVYAVRENQPHIEEALKERYGDGITVVDPFTAKQMCLQYECGSVSVDNTLLERYPKGDQTKALRQPVRHERVYFYKDRIMDLAEVPNGSMNLPSPAERRNAARMWRQFAADMAAEQQRFQAETGFTDRAQLQYHSADHLYVTDDSVEIRRGDRTRCRIWFEDGEIHARNMALYNDDFQEYHETPTYPVLTDIPRKFSEESMKAFAADIHEALYDRPISEQRAVQLADSDPELKAEREEKLQNGYLKPRENNLDIAAEDVAWAVHEHSLPEKTEVEDLSEADSIRLYAAAERQIANDLSKMRSIENSIKKTNKALEAKPDDAEAEALLDRLSDDHSMREMLAIRVADMRDLQEAILDGGSVVQKTGKQRDMTTLSVGGRIMSVNTSRLKQEKLDAAREAIRETMFGVDDDDTPSEGEKESTPEKKDPEKKPEEKTPENDPDGNAKKDELAALGAWLAEAEKDPAMRETDEYREKVARVQELVKDMNDNTSEIQGKEIVSSVRVDAIGGGYSKNFADDGTFLLMKGDGTPAMDCWIRTIYKPTDGVGALLDADGKYRFFDYGNGVPVGEAYKKVSGFSEGFAIVQREDGRMNYMRPDGSYLSKKVWFDDARKFIDGMARVQIKDNLYMIDHDASMRKAVVQEKPAQKPVPPKKSNDKDKDKDKDKGKTPGSGHTPGGPH